MDIIKADLFYTLAICNLNTYHYKVLLLLMEKERTQKELSTELEVAKQNINKICKELLSMDLIYISKNIGKNKYLKINPNPKVQVKGQVRFGCF